MFTSDGRYPDLQSKDAPLPAPGGRNLSLDCFTEWDTPVVSKRLDARYDWLSTRWSQKSYQLLAAGDGCSLFPPVVGALAWLSEGNCSFFTKVCSRVRPPPAQGPFQGGCRCSRSLQVQNMANSNASGVLIHTLAGNPLQDMNCVGDECNTTLQIPAAMVPPEPSVVEALQ